MRKNCQRTINAWKNHESFGKRGDPIWTDGDGIYSYATWIVTCDDSACEEPSPQPKMVRANYTKTPRWTWDGETWTCGKCSDYWCANGPRFLFNATKYSKTTTTHQNAIRAYMDTEGYHLKVHDNVLRGTSYNRMSS